MSDEPEADAAEGDEPEAGTDEATDAGGEAAGEAEAESVEETVEAEDVEQEAEAAEDVEEAAEAEGEAEGEAEVDEEGETDAETDVDVEDVEEGLQEGDFVELSYTIRTVEDGTLVDTTSEEVAEDEGIDTENRSFGPRTLVVGVGHVFNAVDEDLLGKDVGDTGTVVVPAAEAFGEYDGNQVRTVSVDRIPEDDRYPGGHVDIDGQHGHVETIIGGRARVDFNHPLAGEDIEYEYEVADVVEEPIEQARGLMRMYVDVDLDMAIETVEEEQPVYDDEGEETGTETVELETLYVESVPQLAMNQQWLFSKGQIASELIERLGIDRVVVREVFDGSGGGLLGGMGGMDLEDALEDLDEDVDTDELVEELEAETDLEPDADVVEE